MTTGTDQNAICETIASSGSVEIGLQTPCEGYYTINSCPLMYISVQFNVPSGGPLTYTCSGKSLWLFTIKSIR